MSMNVKKGDNVIVITGKDKGTSGKVMEVSPKTNKVTVEGVNVVTKHKKARKQGEQSEIVKKTAPIDASNVMVICSVCGKPTRVGHKEIDGKKVRVCKKCSASLDKEFVKATKKEAKKNVKEAAAKETVAKKSTKETSKTAEPAAKKTAKSGTTAKTQKSTAKKSKED